MLPQTALESAAAILRAADLTVDDLAQAVGKTKHEIPKLLTTQEVANALRCSRMTLHRWRKSGRLVPVFGGGNGRRVLYDKSDVLALLDVESRAAGMQRSPQKKEVN